jgi:hypothetical protein
MEIYHMNNITDSHDNQILPFANDSQFTFFVLIHDIAGSLGYDFQPPLTLGKLPLEMNVRINEIQMCLRQSETSKDSLSIVCQYGTIPDEIAQPVLLEILAKNAKSVNTGGPFFSIEEDSGILVSMQTVSLNTTCAITAVSLLHNLAKQARAWQKECEDLLEQATPDDRIVWM